MNRGVRLSGLGGKIVKSPVNYLAKPWLGEKHESNLILMNQIVQPFTLPMRVFSQLANFNDGLVSWQG
jgi:hypothetical protein